MRTLALLTGSTLLLLNSCTRPSANNVVREFASGANETLIADIASRGELTLAEVLENRQKYGLSLTEVARLKATFTSDEIGRLVLSYIDPNNLKGKAMPRWVYVPNVPDGDPVLSRIDAFDKEGRMDVIDGTKEVEKVAFPIITLSESEKIKGLPKLASASGLKVDGFSLAEPRVTDGGMMLERIRFEDVKEPWIKGAAEVYMMVTYFDKNGKGTSELVELPNVDKAKVDYELHQVVHLWTLNKYQIINVSFMEHDSRHDYSEILKATITAASAVTVAVVPGAQVTALAVAGAASKLATAVVDAMPRSAMTDDDDFIDTINTIEKYKDEERQGISGKVKALFKHYAIKHNDE